MSKQSVVDTVSSFLDIVETRINDAIANKTSIGGTDLATELAPKFGLTTGQAVAIVSMYVSSRSDELVSKKGKGGGIQAKKA